MFIQRCIKIRNYNRHRKYCTKYGVEFEKICLNFVLVSKSINLVVNKYFITA